MLNLMSSYADGRGSPKRASGFLSFFRGIETKRRRYRFPAVLYVYRPCAPIEARQLRSNPNSYVTLTIRAYGNV